ncbi:MAG: response regulator [Terrimonas sp.]|nr:response regulator [Terrimonas sp.]
MPASILIFEDNVELRMTLVSLLNRNENYTVIGHFSDVSNVAAIIKTDLPDVVILDINMPGMNGIEAIPLIKEAHPGVSIVMYTQFEDEDKLFKSLCAGADGYILKKTSPFKLEDAINKVCNGGTPLSPVIAKKILTSFRKKQKPVGLQYSLTRKESEILQLLVKGYSVKFIAAEMDTSYNTTRTHLRNIYTKLHVNCGKEAIAKVLAGKIA